MGRTTFETGLKYSERLQNEDGVENTLGTINYSFSLFCMKTCIVLSIVELAAS